MPVDEWQLTPLTRPGWLSDRLDLHAKASLAGGYDDNVDLRDGGRSDAYGRIGLGLYSRWRGIAGTTASIDADWRRVLYREHDDVDRETIDIAGDLTRAMRVWTYGIQAGYVLLDSYDGVAGRDRRARQADGELFIRRRLPRGRIATSLAVQLVDDRDRDEEDRRVVRMAVQGLHEQSAVSYWGWSAAWEERDYESTGRADGRAMELRTRYQRQLQANLSWLNELGVGWLHAERPITSDGDRTIVWPVGESRLTADFDTGQAIEAGLSMDLQRGSDGDALAVASFWSEWRKPWTRRWSTVLEGRVYGRDRLGDSAMEGWESTWRVSVAWLWRLRRGVAGSLRLAHLGDDSDNGSFTRHLVEVRLHVVF